MNPVDSDEEAMAAAIQLSLGKEKHTSTQEAADHAEAESQLAAELAAEHASTPQLHLGEEGKEWAEEMVPVPVNNELLAQLLDFGFSDARARKGLVHGGSLEGALTWLGEHENDADIDQPYMVRKADTIPKPPMSAEEKARKLEEMKNKIKSRREERAREEKAEEIRREKERRERGQKMDETIEERQRLARKREAERIKKEKDDAAKERARLKAEIARDKEIRRANKGVLPSVLGVDGYNPSIIQYDVPAEHHHHAPASSAPAAHTTAAPTAPKPSAAPAAAPAAPVPVSVSVKKTTTAPATVASPLSPEEKVEQSIGMVMKYRTAGEGGQALKLLNTFIRNIVEHPEDPKFRSINTESAAFKGKVAPFAGTLALLKTVGFEKDESDGKLKYEGDATSALLRFAHTKLNEAEVLYKQFNPA